MRYVKSEYYRTKSVAARFLDRTLTALGIFLASGIFMWSFGVRPIWAAAYSLLFTAACESVAHAVRRSRIEKLAGRLIEEARREIALERLVFCGDALEGVCAAAAENRKYERIDGGIICEDELILVELGHPLAAFEVDCAVRAVRVMRSCKAKRFSVITTAPPTPEAEAIVKGNGGRFDEDIIERVIVGFLPDKGEAEARLTERFEAQRITARRLRHCFTEKGKAKGWALSALMLTAWGLIFGKGALYFTASGICAALCAYSALSDRLAGLKNHRNLT